MITCEGRVEPRPLFISISLAHTRRAFTFIDAIIYRLRVGRVSIFKKNWKIQSAEDRGFEIATRAVHAGVVILNVFLYYLIDTRIIPTGRQKPRINLRSNKRLTSPHSHVAQLNSRDYKPSGLIASRLFGPGTQPPFTIFSILKLVYLIIWSSTDFIQYLRYRILYHTAVQNFIQISRISGGEASRYLRNMHLKKKILFVEQWCIENLKKKTCVTIW